MIFVQYKNGAPQMRGFFITSINTFYAANAKNIEILKSENSK